jgi:hypothetical protein
MYISLHVKCPLFFSDFNETFQIFEKFSDLLLFIITKLQKVRSIKILREQTARQIWKSRSGDRHKKLHFKEGLDATQN